MFKKTNAFLIFFAAAMLTQNASASSIYFGEYAFFSTHDKVTPPSSAIPGTTHVEGLADVVSDYERGQLSSDVGITILTDVQCLTNYCTYKPLNYSGVDLSVTDSSFWRSVDNSDLGYVSKVLKKLIRLDKKGYKKQKTLACRKDSTLSVSNGVCTHKGCGKGASSQSTDRTVCTWLGSDSLANLANFKGTPSTYSNAPDRAFVSKRGVKKSEQREPQDHSISSVDNKNGWLNAMVYNFSIPILEETSSDVYTKLGSLELIEKIERHKFPGASVMPEHVTVMSKFVAQEKQAPKDRNRGLTYCRGSEACSGYQLFEIFDSYFSDPTHESLAVGKYEALIASLRQKNSYKTQFVQSTEDPALKEGAVIEVAAANGHSFPDTNYTKMIIDCSEAKIELSGFRNMDQRITCDLKFK